jgi:hypothetical protein
MSPKAPPKDISQLRARRRDARRRRYIARVDVGLGLVGSLVLLLATPGLAMAMVIALLVLALCLLSVVLERRLARRSGSDDPRRPAPRNGGPAGGTQDELRRVSSRGPGRAGRTNEAGRRVPALDRSAARPSQARDARRRSSSG